MQRQVVTDKFTHCPLHHLQLLCRGLRHCSIHGLALDRHSGFILRVDVVALGLILRVDGVAFGLILRVDGVHGAFKPSLGRRWGICGTGRPLPEQFLRQLVDARIDLCKVGIHFRVPHAASGFCR